MKLSRLYKFNLFFIFYFVVIQHNYSQDVAPELTASGNQVFCPGTAIPIVTDFNITDDDDTGTANFFIQISSGYQVGFDFLELTGNHPNISQSWSGNDGKLTLSSTTNGAEMLFQDLINAVKEVVFTTTATDISLEKTFSLTIDDANYLPATDHFYEFVSNEGITWQNAKIAAENRTYFGRKGYLATLTSEEEANFAGKQVSGAGWIGGSDEETEGVWKWVTGPEAGTVFWNGQVNGTTPNFAKWNNNEPNDFRLENPEGEHYAHITDPSIGIVGAWNDLPNEGGTNLYVPRGYIVEYGAPGDPVLNIAVSTRIYIPQIISTENAIVCESGLATITANASEGEIVWFDSETGGLEVGRGSNFTTPILTNSTTYYATIALNGCLNFDKIPVLVDVINRPSITNVTNDLVCSGTALLSATPSSGSVFWYETETSTEVIATGVNFRTPVLTATRSYFVEASSFNCVSFNRTEIIATLDATVPTFEIEQENYVLCNNVGSVTLRTVNALGSYNYFWTRNNTVFSGNSPEITTNQIGEYTVKAVSEAGCESLEQTIIVKNSEIASVVKEDVVIMDYADNITIEIVNDNLGVGDYEFALDNEFGTYQEIGFFDNITTGIHTLFIRDKGGCGVKAYKFSILEYSKFFTPNNDGINDYWNIKGFDKDFYTISEIYIFNRFGVLIHKIDIDSLGWDGTYEGKILPSDSYWFKAKLTDINGFTIEKTGNFSLLRK
ncbi:T9SS type B sorting domain-containing protein [uncultured Polaribacter sp.]|uniref:Ig-like domain-containing protein n=1 Tax=uncultured Polaribacter sp. TaxID=174711 RepID=UPI002638C622|nr:T9SS type B sorting domain-containing protein [uncultured Polaribacter sp.]